MKVYELIQELAWYPADAEVSVLIGNNTKLDIDCIRPEFRNQTESVVMEAG